MSYDVYWVKNRAEKIADFEHPTCKGNSIEPQIVALTGRNAHWSLYTQGVALGYVVLPLRGVPLTTFDTT